MEELRFFFRFWDWDLQSYPLSPPASRGHHPWAWSAHCPNQSWQKRRNRRNRHNLGICWSDFLHSFAMSRFWATPKGFFMIFWYFDFGELLWVARMNCNMLDVPRRFAHSSQSLFKDSQIPENGSLCLCICSRLYNHFLLVFAMFSVCSFARVGANTLRLTQHVATYTDMYNTL